MKKKVIITALAAAAAFAVIYWKMGPPLPASYQYSSVSPDNKYRVDVYSEAFPTAAMPGQGGAGSRAAKIILRNSWGWKIGSSDGCDISMDYVAIEWNYANNAVDIAKARSISLDTGECAE